MASTPITVTNTVSVKNEDNAARNPFQKTLHTSTVTGGGPDSFAVPGNFRLVIETLAVRGSILSGAIYPWIQTKVGGFYSNHYFHFFKMGKDEVAGEIYQAALPLRLYADPGTEVYLNLNQSTGGTDFELTVNVSGYLVALP